MSDNYRELPLFKNMHQKDLLLLAELRRWQTQKDFRQKCVNMLLSDDTKVGDMKWSLLKIRALKKDFHDNQYLDLSYEDQLLVDLLIKA